MIDFTAKNPTPKVYCKECKYFRDTDQDGGSVTPHCKHPENWIDHWKEQINERPWIRNKNNTCTLFVHYLNQNG